MFRKKTKVLTSIAIVFFSSVFFAFSAVPAKAVSEYSCFVPSSQEADGTVICAQIESKTGSMNFSSLFPDLTQNSGRCRDNSYCADGWGSGTAGKTAYCCITDDGCFEIWVKGSVVPNESACASFGRNGGISGGICNTKNDCQADWTSTPRQSNTSGSSSSSAEESFMCVCADSCDNYTTQAAAEANCQMSGCQPLSGTCATESTAQQQSLPNQSEESASGQTEESGSSGEIRLVNPLSSGATDLPVILGQVIKGALGALGSLALLMLVWGGFQWLTSAGNPEKVKKGTQTMVWAAVGVAIALASYFLVSTVIKALSGSI